METSYLAGHGPRPVTTLSLTAAFAVLMGLFLVVEGAWGLVSPLVFGIFATNMLHAAIHIALGIAGVVLGIQNRPAGVLLLLGALMLVIGVLRFLPGVGEWVAQLLAVNGPMAIFSILVGLVALGLGASFRGRR